MSVLEVRNLVKQFDNVLAVDDLSFSVSSGEIFGFLGGNGAGKTTTLRMVLDIIRPTSGKITVLGGAPDRRQANAIGFLPEERGLYPGMSAIDTIIYFGRLNMSKGMAQKVQLATALVNDPDLLMLDEPFSGLDPVNQGLLEDEILEASSRGAAVIFSTHVMQHAERLCDRLLLLRKGSKRFEGTLSEARAQLPATIMAVAKVDLASLPGVASAEQVGMDDDGWPEWRVALNRGVPAGNVLEHCSSNGIALRRWDERSASLHDIFVQLVGDEGVQA